MARPARAGLIGMAAATMLSGCILFPPFFPVDPPFGETSMVVENTTDDDWVVSFGGELPQAFAAPAGVTGVAALLGSQPTEVSAYDRECEEQVTAPIEVGSEVTTVRIDGPGQLTTTTDAPPAEDLDPLGEVFDCPIAFGLAPTAGEAIEAEGSIRLIGEDAGAYVLVPASASLTQAVAGDFNAFTGEYTWSPDGARIAYSSFGDTAGQSIFVADADGANERLLVEDGAMPAWSPDGERIAFIGTDPFEGSGVLSVIAADGSGDPTRLAEDVIAPYWAPDSTLIAYQSGTTQNDPFGEPSDVSMVDVESGAVTVLSELSAPVGPLVWSPDGATLAFASGQPGADAQIMGVDVATGSHQTIANLFESSLTQPAFSPDGSRIAFVVETSAAFSLTSGLAVADAGSESGVNALVESEAAFFSSPIWSPDGRYVAAVRSGSDLSSELIVVGAGGGEPVVVATGGMSIAGWVR